MKVLDFSDEVIKINIGEYLIPRLYVAAVIVDETVYKFPFESFKKLIARLQRENILFSLEYKSSEREDLLTLIKVRERILAVLFYKKSIMIASCA